MKINNIIQKKNITPSDEIKQYLPDHFQKKTARIQENEF